MELMLLTASFYFLRTKTNTPPRTRVGELQEHKFRQRLGGHPMALSGQARPQHLCPLTQSSPVPALFPGPPSLPAPCVLASPNFSLLLQTPKSLVLPGMPPPTSTPWSVPGVEWVCTALYHGAPHLLKRGGFLGQRPVWFLVHRVSPNPRVC